ncbi:MAG: aldo/keto reductase [Armatimonadota bacterium]
MKRRDFISRVAAVGLSASAAVGQASAGPQDRLPRRPYGNTGRKLSIIGLGGIVVSEIEQSDANDTVAWAVERGVNYFDVAPTYGNAQERLGPALKPYRKDAFLACKTTKRDAAGAQAELEESLRQLQTDHFDLYQLHGVTKMEDVDTILGPGGALEAFVKAREKGQVRYIGFSAHSVDAAIRLMDAFDFDSVLFPLNVVCFENGNFGPQVLQKAKQKGAACLALKAMAWTVAPRGERRKYPKCWYQPADDRRLARLALSFTLDLPVVAAIPPGDPGLFRMAVELAQEYRPLTDDERRDLLARAKGVQPIFRHSA